MIRDATRPGEPAEPASYWAVVGAQLRKNRIAMAALALVKALVLVAVLAPFLAANVPLLLREGGAWSSPAVDLLFDRFVYPSGVDVFFNLLLLLGPGWWLAGRVGAGVRRSRAGEGTARLAAFALSLGVLVGFLGLAVLGGAHLAGRLLLVAGAPGAVLLGLAYAAGRARWIARARLALAALFLAALALLGGPWRETRALVDWRAKAESVAAEGRGFAVFPLVPFHPDNVGEGGPGPTSRSLARPNARNWLGCDLSGRDVLARLVFGTRVSLTIGLVAVAIFIGIGTALGSLAGYYQGFADIAISRLVEVMICFPSLFLILTIIAVFESRSIFLIMAVIGLVGWPGVTRLVRAEFLRQRNLDYVVAAKAQGIPERRIIFGHVLPNCLGPVLVSATFGIASAILVESGLAFLGLGDTTAASWGQMLNAGRSEGQWHLIVAPGFAIFLVVTVFNLLGEGLQDALDPKLRR